MQPALPYRAALRILLVLAYLSFAFASLMHPVSHLFHSPIDNSGLTSLTDRATDGKQSGKQLPASDADHGERNCFFCLHGPTVLLLTTFVVLFFARVIIRSFASRMPDRVIQRPGRPITSLRAPPAFA